MASNSSRLASIPPVSRPLAGATASVVTLERRARRRRLTWSRHRRSHESGSMGMVVLVGIVVLVGFMELLGLLRPPPVWTPPALSVPKSS